jgi:hypothetical protein
MESQQVAKNRPEIIKLSELGKSFDDALESIC